MTKRDDSIGPETGHDELEQPKLVPPRDIKTPRAVPVVDDPVLTVSSGIALFDRLMAPTKMMVRNVHDLVVGPIDDNGKPVKGDDGLPVAGLSKTIHTTNKHLSNIEANTDTLFDAHDQRSLVDRVAEACASKMIELFQTQVLAIVARVEKLEEANDHVGTNGTVPPSSL